MKSLTLSIKISGKRLSYLQMLARTLDDPKRLTSTGKKLFNLALDRSGRAVEACIEEAKGENEGA